MDTFPPIVERRTSVLTAYSSKRASGAGSDRAAADAWIAATRAASLDDVVVDRSRAAASRVRAGYRDTDTLATMLRRVRLQFLHRLPDVETSVQPPLVFPPAVPSRMRPAQPHTVDFSRGIRLLQTLRRDATPEAPGHMTNPNDGEDPTRSGRRHSPKPASSPHRSSDGTLAALPGDGEGSAVAANLCLPVTSPSGGGEHTSVLISADGQPTAPPRFFRPPSSTGSEHGDALAEAVTPVFELTSPTAQYAQLRELEECDRQHLAATEVWGRQAVCEMMMVHYVTFVLALEMDELIAEEREARAVVRFSEEQARYELCETSELAITVRNEVRAVRARELKLARLARVDAQLARPKAAMTASSAADTPADGSGDPRAVLESYVAMKHGRAIRQGAELPSPPASPNHPGTPATSPAEDARARGLSAFERAAVEAKGRARGRLSLVPTLRPDGTPSSRRGSGLVLPPLVGGGRQLPRRNTVGVANYIALLEEDGRWRARIAAAEAADRAEILTLAQAQWNAVRAWQHKKLHLERLLYWRAAREQREQAELAIISDVAGEAAVRGRAAAAALAAAVEELQGREGEQRDAVRCAESEARAGVNVAAAQLAVARAVSDMTAAHCAAQRATLVRLLSLQADIVCRAEAHTRSAVAQEWEGWLTSTAEPRAAVLQLLHGVTQTPGWADALGVLQHAFRRCAAGQLGWRLTHRRIGQEVRRRRAEQRVQRGREQLAAMRCAIEEEWAEMIAAWRAEHEARVRTLCDLEFNRRLAMVAQEGWTFDTVRRQFIEELRTNVTEPAMRRCLALEGESRLDLVVREELVREQLLQWFAKMAALAAELVAVVATEASTRRAAVLEEDAVRARLHSAKVDDAEDMRLEQEARAVRAAEARDTFCERALREHANTCEVLGRALAEVHVRGQLALLGDTALGTAWVAALAVEEAQARERLSEVYAAETLVALTMERAVQAARNSLSARVHALEEEEAAARAQWRGEEAAAWEQAIGKDLYDTPSGQQVYTYQQQRRAVGVIATAYMRTRDRELGRTATRQYLHEAFEVRRELAELRAIRARQRAVVRRAEGQLAAQLAEERADAQEACQFLMDLAVTRTEPRQRAELQEAEVFLRNLIFRNFFPDAALVDPSGDPIVAVEQRVDRELVERREARDRTTIAAEWAAVFEHYFSREWLPAVEEAQARVIQRVWRAHRHRQRARRLRGGTLDAIAAQECEGRLKRELEEVEAFALDVVRPYVAATAGLEAVQEVLPAALDGMCNDVGRQQIAQAERRGRMALLWDMRFALCDDVLCADEARARDGLMRAEHLPGLQHAQLKAEEALVRSLLMRERQLFLLRVLVKEEAAARQFGVLVDYARGVEELRVAAPRRAGGAAAEKGAEEL